jgi:hypothetical protein
MTDEISRDWYGRLVDECRSIVVEHRFASNWALVEGYWNLGKRLREEGNVRKWKRGETESVVKRISSDIHVSVRTIYHALAAYDKYPDMDKLPEGKAISWHKLVNKYLYKHNDGTGDQIHKAVITLEFDTHDKTLSYHGKCIETPNTALTAITTALCEHLHAECSNRNIPIYGKITQE